MLEWKGCFVQEVATWGEVGLMSKNQFQRFYWAIKVFKAVTGRKSQLIVEIEGQSHHHAPLCAGLFADLLTSCDLSLDSVLFTQLVWEITEGEA